MITWLKSLCNILSGGPKNRQQLMTALEQATDRHILTPDNFRMIESVIQMSDMQVHDVMVPASQMIVVEQNSPLAAILPVVIESGHSRFPVMKGQEVTGILLAKDLLVYSIENQSAFRMDQVIRPAFFVPQSKKLDLLLREFRIRRNHIAVVVDEYGNVAGLITIENVLEEIVGEIEDEYDTDEDEDICRRSENSYFVKGSTSLSAFNAYFKDAVADNESSTIGDFVVKGFGHFPLKGEIIRIGNYRFKVLQGDSKRIHMLEVRQPSQSKTGLYKKHAPSS